MRVSNDLPAPATELPPLRLAAACRAAMLEHCRRKLAGSYLPGEDRNRKAFGLLAGTRSPGGLVVSRCFPLLANARHHDCHRDYMNRMMDEHAIPSETPLAKRGWVADPEELAGVVKTCRQDNLLLLGSYHMHRVAWEHDRLRDTPTSLDTILGRDSRLIMLIVSMVDPDQPRIRAFDEGKIEREYPIRYI